MSHSWKSVNSGHVKLSSHLYFFSIMVFWGRAGLSSAAWKWWISVVQAPATKILLNIKSMTLLCSIFVFFFRLFADISQQSCVRLAKTLVLLGCLQGMSEPRLLDEWAYETKIFGWCSSHTWGCWTVKNGIVEGWRDVLFQKSSFLTITSRNWI